MVDVFIRLFKLLNGVYWTHHLVGWLVCDKKCWWSELLSQYLADGSDICYTLSASFVNDPVDM